MRRWRWSSTPARMRKRRRDKNAKLRLGRFKSVNSHSRSLNGIRRVTLAQQQTPRDLLLSSFCPFAAPSFVAPGEHSETRGRLAYPRSPPPDGRRVDPGSQACPGLDPGPGRRRVCGDPAANTDPSRLSALSSPRASAARPGVPCSLSSRDPG